METTKLTSRRDFLGKMAASTAAGAAVLSAPAMAKALTRRAMDDADAWFKKAKGAHRIVYDATEPHDAMPLIWAWVFYQTNNETGTTDKEMTGMVVMRHNAIPFAFEDRLWDKYKLGEIFNITDNVTKKAAVRNPYYVPEAGAYPFPGIDGIKRLQERGAMFCVCNMAMKVYSGVVAEKMGKKHEEVLTDWKSGILPNIQLVPSGVWAVGRAQENGFAYCYAGG